MRQPTLCALAAITFLSTTTAVCAAEGVPWRQHEQPFSFVFGNAIDGHQQTRVGRDGRLDGYLYVQYTGVVTQDGLPVATHVDCGMAGARCSVGWHIDARPSRAKLVLQPMHDHPVFWLPRADLPQPGSYAHFHWTGMTMPMPYLDVPGYLMQLTAANSFCFIHHGAEAASSALSCRDNAGLAVRRGVDIATHLNVVTTDSAGR